MSDLPNGFAVTLIIGCDAGTVGSGGVKLGQAVINVAIDADGPAPATGTPTGWEVTVANASGVSLTMVVQVVCATSADSSSSAASQGQGAHIVKRVMTKLKPANG
jgi:hypothetical protein